MIVTCQQCEARFKLDESRIPAKGARVRCSRCKHAFHVAHPTASRDEALAEVVAEATGPGAGRVPAATADPFGPGDTDPGLSRSLAELDRGDARGDDAEEEWEFNEDPPPAPSGRRAPRGAAPAEARRPASAPRGRPRRKPEPPSEELGSPDQWDLLGGRPARPPAAPPAPPEPEAELELARPRFAETPRAAPPPPPPAPPRKKVAAPPRRRAPAAAADTPGARPLAAPAGLRRMASLAGGIAGWLLALALLGMGLAPALRAPEAAAPPAPAAHSAEVFGLEAREVRGAFVENSFAGPLYVVTGHLESPAAVAWSAYGGLEVRLVAAGGAPLPDGSTLAGPPLADELVRELPPAQLQDALARASAGLLAPPWQPGERRPFQAVFAAVPEGAADLALVGVALEPPAQETDPGAAEAAGTAPDAAAEAARASSPPSPRPSSG